MNDRRAAVIGSGFGGLAVAIRLQAAGFQTVVYEKRDLPGGRAYVYRDRGFTFDAGPTVITAPTCLEELFQVAGRRMEDYAQLLPVEPFYRLFWEDGFRFDYSNNEKSLFDQIQKKSPADVEGYKKFLAYSKDVFKEGFEELAHVPFLDWWSMIRVAPQLIRLSAHRSVYQTVSNHIRDPQLRQAFSFHSLLVGGNPFTVSSIYTLIHYLERKWGVFFPKGGTGALIRALVQLLTELGGDIRLNSPVEKISTREGRVTGIQTEDGRIESFQIVVSNADVVHTYNTLLKQEPLAKKTATRVMNMTESMSLFLIYFGTNKKYSGLAHHNVLFGPRYKELLSDIFDRGVLADDFSLYLHAPTVSDPSLAPADCEAFYVLSPAPNLGKLNIDWKTEGPRYGQKILDFLEKRYLPDLKRHLITTRIFTPDDFRLELNAHLGSAFSHEPLLRQSAYFRTHNRDGRIRGLYFVGAGTHPGAGVPGVVSSAKATANLVVQDFGTGDSERTQGAKIPASAVRNPRSEFGEAVACCENRITRGSKSFSLASRIFGADMREAAFCLYGWCRYCDDEIDGGKGDKLEQLNRLSLLTKSAYAGEKMSDLVFIAFRHVTKKYRIPIEYPLDLLEGMAMDVREDRYETLDDLLLYAYRVAGTVGLMMSHIMGLSDERALRNACDMGMAMQLTNIARDVMEDAAMGRVYLPQTWLKEHGVLPEKIMDPLVRKHVALLVRHLLESADQLYRSGDQGLKYLSFRAACAIASARHIYSEIGHRVRRRGPSAWDSRTIVPATRKIFVMGRGVLQAAALLPARIHQPWEPAPINTVWRFS